ncbi:MAG TPA: triose-phosphate isomerase [Candidatus Baltobacteraceae bacterium]|nr:triose-phosphate isomerase [Candidatus Baltobacteraceae bacterium]
MARTIVAGNWKMHKTAAETRAYLEAFLPLAARIPDRVEIVIAPPFTALAAAHDVLRGHPRVALGAQNVHWELQGAFTGEISVLMLREFGVRFAIVGHSERRTFFNELDRTVNLKVKTLLAHGVTPIVAVGETEAERADGKTIARVTAQTTAALEGLDRDAVGRVVLAYEPIWAIGTGANCDPVEANRVMNAIRGSLRGLKDVPILYGGSVKPDNVGAYADQPDINGGLVGGASLDPQAFATLIEAAAARG